MCGGVSVYTRKRVLDWIDNHICPVYVDDGNVLRFRCIHSWHRWAFICTWELLKKTMIATVGDSQNGCENIIIRTARQVLCQLIIVPIYCQRYICASVLSLCNGLKEWISHIQCFNRGVCLLVLHANRPMRRSHQRHTTWPTLLTDNVTDGKTSPINGNTLLIDVGFQCPNEYTHSIRIRIL